MAGREWVAARTRPIAPEQLWEKVGAGRDQPVSLTEKPDVGALLGGGTEAEDGMASENGKDQVGKFMLPMNQPRTEFATCHPTLPEGTEGNHSSNEPRDVPRRAKGIPNKAQGGPNQEWKSKRRQPSGGHFPMSTSLSIRFESMGSHRSIHARPSCTISGRISWVSTVPNNVWQLAS